MPATAQDTVKTHAGVMRARIGDGLESFNEEARARVLRARAQAYEAQRSVEAAAEKSKTAFHKHPLAFGLGAVALGAAVAALLPRSDSENKRQSAHRDALMRQAKAIYAEEKRKLTAAARAATTETKHQLREAVDKVSGDGLEDGVKATAAEAAEKITKSAQSAYDAKASDKDAAAGKAKSAKPATEAKPASTSTPAPNGLPNGRA